MPLLIADRSFFPNGSINYPNVGDNPAIHPIWIPEYFGSTNTVNGKVSTTQYRTVLYSAAG